MASAASREPSASPPALTGRVGTALTVGVMGGAGHDIPEAHLAKAEELGEVIGEQGCVLVTGACPGLPFAAARGVKRKGATVIGISPGLSLYEHAYKYESPTAYHDILIFTGSGLMGREVVNIRSSDIVAFIGGSLLMNTGERVFSRPILGAWMTYGLGTENQNLPGFVAICPGRIIEGARQYG